MTVTDHNLGESRRGAPPPAIVVPHYSSLDFTRACLATIAFNTPDPHHVIIVDNGTGHALPGRVIRNDSNLGFARACNQGAAAAQADIVVFLNNDAEPLLGWLSPLVHAISEHGAAAAAGRVLYMDGTDQHTGVRLVRYPNGRLGASNDVGSRASGPVRAVSATCLAVDRAAFLEVGGFDERYWNGYEDIDLSLRLGEAGYVVWYEPDSVVRHVENGGGAERWTRSSENARIFNARWGELQEDEVYPRTRYLLNGGVARLRSLAQFPRRHLGRR
jgi:GT2 family glycosyltransferase